ncbi:MAG: peptidylprolyl isomerase [Solirubrobacteraceae bacterium]|nr:peptidylprolyl isomerase [Solirubrobacteraceae bacterium]
MQRATILVILLLAVPALVACGKDDTPGDAATTTATAPEAAATATTDAVVERSAKDGCKAVAPPQPASNPDRTLSKKRLNRSRTHTAVMRTNCGTIRIRLAVRDAPKTTSSFAGLARNTFFDGLTFHRIAKPGGNDYVIQGGDPLGTGNGSPGYSVVETPSSTTTYRRYDVAMAKTQAEAAGTSGSQFFIVTAEDSQLPPEYAVLGRVVGGQDVVRRIARLETDLANEMPRDPVVISSVRITSSN